SEEIKAFHPAWSTFNFVRMELQMRVSSEYIVDDEELLRYFGKMCINRFHIENSIECATGLYLGMSTFDHSCSPDAFVRFRGRMAILRSPNVGQKYSDTMTVSYTDLHATTAKRRE
ncbi:hypothetical protein PFISCL1PPCAC_24346, partial [Pristionchus fissidentatus]